MDIIRQREHITEVEFRLAFDHSEAERGFGYSFLCDERGNVDESKLAEGAVENYRMCMAGYGIPRGVERYEHSYTIPKQGRCSCGEVVDLDGFTNTCQCGRDYNSSGVLLAPRDQWGEETGEHWTDIINCDYSRDVEVDY